MFSQLFFGLAGGAALLFLALAGRAKPVLRPARAVRRTPRR